MKSFILSLIISLAPLAIFSQSQISVRISAPENDMEEYAMDINQTETPGSIDAGSSDLELGSEREDGSRAQLVGLRFDNLSIPTGSVILSASIQFTVDESKTGEPAEIIVAIEDSENAMAFEEVDNNISSRPLGMTSVTWSIGPDTWLTPGESGEDQRTPDLAQLIQSIIDKDSWQSGNALAFVLSGTGTRVAESFEGDPSAAAQLTVDFIAPAMAVNYSKRISAAEDDMEEYIADPQQSNEVGSIDSGSSDLELGTERENGDDKQLVGLRFRDLDIPVGAIIESASIQFTVDESKSTEDASFIIKVEDIANASLFDESINSGISGRPTIEDSVEWNVTGGTWINAGDSGPDQRTSDVSGLLQQIISKPDWSAGNAVVFTIEGTGTKVAESFEGDPTAAALLEVSYFTTKDVTSRVSEASDDMEEYLDDPQQSNEVGSIDSGSSDLELGAERENGDDKQMVGLRFQNVELTAFDDIQNAYIQFTVDESKSTEDATFIIRAEAASNPVTFDDSQAFNISSRPTLEDSVIWNVEGGTWVNPGDAGPNQRTADISSLINALVQQQDWMSGNAMVFHN